MAVPCSEVTDGIENILADAESGDANGQADEKYNNPQPNSRLHELAAAFCRQAERGDAQKLRQMLDALPVWADLEGVPGPAELLQSLLQAHTWLRLLNSLCRPCSTCMTPYN